MACTKGTSTGSSWEDVNGCDSCSGDPKATIDFGSTLPDLDEISPAVVTEIVVTGTGVFDDYMNAGHAQLTRLFEEGRLKGADFAAAHIEMAAIMMKEANGFAIQMMSQELAIIKAKLEMELIAEKIVSEKLQQQILATQEEEARKTGATERMLKGVQAQELVANGKSKRALEDGQNNVATQQCALYEAQAKGFPDKLMNDAYKTTMNSWAVSASELENVTVPETLVAHGAGNAGIDGVIKSALSKAGI